MMTNNKTGMNYYSVDTDRYQDRRIKRLKKDWGCKGIAVYDYILCETYRVLGCYLEWDDNTAFDVAEYFGLEENTVKEIVRYCGSVGLFNKALLSRGVITSASIQRRYTDMCTRTHRRTHIPDKCKIPNECEDECEEKTTTSNEASDIPLRYEPYTLTLEQEIGMLKSDDCWLDQLKVLHSMETAKLRTCLDDFKVQCFADGKESHQSLQDAKSHFNNWMRIVNSKNRKKDDSNRPKGSNQRRQNILESDAEKTYGEAF